MQGKENNEVNKAPVFIVGCSRSGTTLCGAVLNKHPDLFILIEEGLFCDKYKRWMYNIRARSMGPRDAFLDVFIPLKLNLNFGVPVSSIRDRILESRAEWPVMLDAYMQILMKKVKPTAVHWGCKTPSHVADLDHIVSNFPEARIIYMYRDPRSVVSSLTKPTFRGAGNDLVINAEVVRNFSEVYRKKKKWVSDKHLLEVRYEALVERPEESVRNVCSFLKLSYKPALLEGADSETRRIGWSDYKGWTRIQQQPVMVSEFQHALISRLLKDVIKERKYDVSDNVPVNCFVVFMSKAKMLTFRMLCNVLQLFYQIKHPGFVLVMAGWPSLKLIGTWLHKKT